MLARIRKSVEEKDAGFTLVELLVVMIIIGILAAIAIPVFLNQRQKAVDSSMKSDLKTIATAEETYFVDRQVYYQGDPTTASTTATPALGVALSTGNKATVTVTNGTYCVLVDRVTNASSGSQAAWVYKSAAGGIQPAGTTTC